MTLVRQPISAEELRKVQTLVATAVGMLDGADLESACDLMDDVQKRAGAIDPLMWARTKEAHLRMRALMEAALVFQNTVNNIRGHIPRPTHDPRIVLPS